MGERGERGARAVQRGHGQGEVGFGEADSEPSFLNSVKSQWPLS